ncbi:MAG: glycosyltransferase [Desulfobacteraceae bacterium]|nr:glycosyltransferase [Desulfobacteraceae bacterium]
MPEDRPQKILFVTLCLAGGGAERIVQLLLTHIDRSRHSPTLILLEDKVEYEIPPDITVKCLHKRTPVGFFRLIYKLAKILKQEKPDAVISFLTYPNIVLLLAKLLIRYKGNVFVSERSNPEVSISNQNRPRLFRFLVRKLYPLSNCVISLSKGVADRLDKGFSIPKEKIRVIHNSIDTQKVKTKARELPNWKWYQDTDMPIIIAVGRLTKAKAYPDLLRAFAAVRQKYPCRLVILGEGREQQALNKLAAHLDIPNDVAFLGFQENPFSFMAHSNVFALSSHWEGFGNVIIEAMACGVPVVSTNCPYGPSEIITDGVNGLLVPVGDTDAMAEAVLKLLKDETIRKRLAEAGEKRAEDFRVEKMVAEYEKVFEEDVSQ